MPPNGVSVGVTTGSTPTKLLKKKKRPRFRKRSLVRGSSEDKNGVSNSSTGGTPTKCVMRRKKKVRKRCLVRGSSEDFFDPSTMEQIQFGLHRLNQLTGLDITGTHSVTFNSSVTAVRKDKTGAVMKLLHWLPEDMIPDEWVAAEDEESMKRKVVPLSSLPKEVVTMLVNDTAFTSQEAPPTRQKQRRKNTSSKKPDERIEDITEENRVEMEEDTREETLLQEADVEDQDMVMKVDETEALVQKHVLDFNDNIMTDTVMMNLTSCNEEFTLNGKGFGFVMTGTRDRDGVETSRMLNGLISATV